MYAGRWWQAGKQAGTHSTEQWAMLWALTAAGRGERFGGGGDPLGRAHPGRQGSTRGPSGAGSSSLLCGADMGGGRCATACWRTVGVSGRFSQGGNCNAER